MLRPMSRFALVLASALSLAWPAAAQETPTIGFLAPPDVPLLASIAMKTLGPDSKLYGRYQGAEVLDIDPESPAGQAGLHKGDIILGINQIPVASPEELVTYARLAPVQIILIIFRRPAVSFIRVH